MRGYNNLDSNQHEIVKYLRYAGCTVQLLNKIKKGCPDILVGCGDVNYLFEIKDGSKPPSARKLTIDEITWHRVWRGQVAIVYSFADCMRIMGR
jgi:Holliday junction resolvase